MLFDLIQLLAQQELFTPTFIFLLSRIQQMKNVVSYDRLFMTT